MIGVGLAVVLGVAGDLDRTAYPRFAVLSARELGEAFTPTEAEVEWARSCTDDPHHLLALVVW